MRVLQWMQNMHCRRQATAPTWRAAPTAFAPASCWFGATCVMFRGDVWWERGGAFGASIRRQAAGATRLPEGVPGSGRCETCFWTPPIGTCRGRFACLHCARIVQTRSRGFQPCLSRATRGQKRRGFGQNIARQEPKTEEWRQAVTRIPTRASSPRSGSGPGRHGHGALRAVSGNGGGATALGSCPLRLR